MVILSEAKDRFRATAVELPRRKAILRRFAPQDDTPGSPAPQDDKGAGRSAPGSPRVAPFPPDDKGGGVR